MIKDILYVLSDFDKREFICAGITFYDFIRYIKPRIENIMLIKGDYIGDKCNRYRFELIENYENILKLSKENICRYGDFSFIDFSESNITDKLTPTEISSLLYISHMFEPLDKVFYEILENKFLYLSHDDGFFCKIYCRNVEYFSSVLYGKIKNSISDFSNNIQSINKTIEVLLHLTKKGLFIDFSDTTNLNVVYPIYLVGEVDIDKLLNCSNQYKKEKFLYGWLLNEDNELKIRFN